MLKVNGIDAYYGDVCALHDISLEIGDDEIISIIGSNGAGKTTLMNCIVGWCRLPRYLTKPRQRRSEWDMAGSDGISRVSTVFRGKSLLTNKMRII